MELFLMFYFCLWLVNLLSAKPTKRPDTLKQYANCLSVFDHFLGLAFKGLIHI